MKINKKILKGEYIVAGEYKSLFLTPNEIKELDSKFTGNWYKCNKCGRLYNRISSKKWINSFCTKTDKQGRLYLFLENKPFYF